MGCDVVVHKRSQTLLVPMQEVTNISPLGVTSVISTMVTEFTFLPEKRGTGKRGLQVLVSKPQVPKTPCLPLRETAEHPLVQTANWCPNQKAARNQRQKITTTSLPAPCITRLKQMMPAQHQGYKGYLLSVKLLSASAETLTPGQAGAAPTCWQLPSHNTATLPQ